MQAHSRMLTEIDEIQLRIVHSQVHRLSSATLKG